MVVGRREREREEKREIVPTRRLGAGMCLPSQARQGVSISPSLPKCQMAGGKEGGKGRF